MGLFSFLFPTYETWRIVIFDRFRIAKCLKDWIRLQKLLLEFSLQNFEIRIKKIIHN